MPDLYTVFKFWTAGYVVTLLYFYGVYTVAGLLGIRPSKRVMTLHADVTLVLAAWLMLFVCWPWALTHALPWRKRG